MASTEGGTDTVEEGPETAAARVLRMDFAGSLVKHLGLQMYSGAVPAIAELISNSYDADATKVEVNVPLDAPLTASSEIVIRDDGIGMTFDDLNDKYLVVGRDRRTTGDRSPGGRLVLGRKGLGKLAGFGIAKVVTVTSVREGWLTSFRMSYDKILASNTQPYKPTVLDDRAARKGEFDGTEIRLSELQLKQRIPSETFFRSMGRRFSILGATFVVEINGQALEADSTELQFRYPETGYETADIGGVGTVQWWVGFTEKPIKNDDIRGVSVLSRGKLAQAPFFFELGGGTQSQLGLQYMTGQVFADGLDAAGEDLIATDRASILWENPVALPLLEWGQDMIRDALRRWAAARATVQIQRLRGSTPYMDRIERFPERQQRELLKAIDALSNSPTIEDERLDEIVRILLNAYENEQFFSLLKELSQLPAESQASLVELFEEWDVLEAVQVAQQVRGRVIVVQTLRRLIRNRAPEKPVMQDLLEKHPWLIDPAWEMYAHEMSLERVLRERFHSDINEGDQRRLDFLCIGDNSTAVVIEVKRPGFAIGYAELQQLQGYVHTLRARDRTAGNVSTNRQKFVGVMIYSHLSTSDPSVAEFRDELIRDGYVIEPWDHLLEKAERAHRDYLEIIKERAPDDPRIEGIDDLAEVEPPRDTEGTDDAHPAEVEAGDATEMMPAESADRPAAPRPSAPRTPPPWALPPAH
jgi:hypothetical protein